MVVGLMLFAAGMLAWTFVEYALHGWMSHRFVTFATPLHQVHHRDPAAVFAIGAWLPTAAVLAFLLIHFEMTPAMVFVCGLVAGFAAYEAVHYRLHFARPASRFETRLRTRHLAHHIAIDDRCLGVTSPLWDWMFGTEPSAAEMAACEARVRAIKPIAGRSNLGRVADATLSDLKRRVSLSGKAK